MSRITEDQLLADFLKMGVRDGDTVLVRADLGAVGRVAGSANAFIGALLRAVGPEGTLVSLAFTDSAFLRKPKPENAFDLQKKSYAGAFPNAMVSWPGSFRSSHPTCSYVAIGKHARELTEGHDERSSAYEPVRKVVELRGKNLLVGCVGNSPGFTTTHLAEADLGMLRSLPVFPKLNSTYYKSSDGTLRLFRRGDPGLCSKSFYKFYALYVREEILTTGFVGKAYSILAPAKECYEIEHAALKKNRKLNICDSPLCRTCNAGRWDRIHHAPLYVARLLLRRVKKAISAKGVA